MKFRVNFGGDIITCYSYQHIIDEIKERHGVEVGYHALLKQIKRNAGVCMFRGMNTHIMIDRIEKENK